MAIAQARSLRNFVERKPLISGDEGAICYRHAAGGFNVGRFSVRSGVRSRLSVPLKQKLQVGAYILKQKLKGVERYPLVLMLEPLFRCNLACSGCGKIDYPDPILNKRISVEDALAAVDECGAPVVSVAGGEPLIHKEMPEIIRGIVARRKFVYLCTNALLLEKRDHVLATFIKCAWVS